MARRSHFEPFRAPTGYYSRVIVSVRPNAVKEAIQNNLNRFKDAKLLADLDRLLDPVTRGDPMAPLRWTVKSTTRLAEELRVVGHEVSQATVWRLLDMLGYSMQSNRKSREGTDHPDRNAQFEYALVSQLKTSWSGDCQPFRGRY